MGHSGIGITSAYMKLACKTGKLERHYSRGIGMASISSAHDPRATVCQFSACARRGGFRVHWSPRKSPRDIFSCFFLGAAHRIVSYVVFKFVAVRRGAKKPPRE
jgi:hypothetical protein